MATPLQPTSASVVQLLDSVVTTRWPISTAECEPLWSPLGIRLAELTELPPGHDDLLMQELGTGLEGPVESSLISTPDGRPRSLGLFLYSSETDEADQETKLAFDAITGDMTETWGPNVLQDRNPGARVWEVDGQVVELYLHARPTHPRTGQLVGPACLQIGLGPPEPDPFAPGSAT